MKKDNDFHAAIGFYVQYKKNKGSVYSDILADMKTEVSD